MGSHHSEDDLTVIKSQKWLINAGSVRAVMVVLRLACSAHDQRVVGLNPTSTSMAW